MPIPAHAADAIMGSVALTEDAMRDWEKKYPHDSWIPPAIFSLERLYAKVDSDDARAHAKFVMVWLVHDYPASAPGEDRQERTRRQSRRRQAGAGVELPRRRPATPTARCTDNDAKKKAPALRGGLFVYALRVC